MMNLKMKDKIKFIPPSKATFNLPFKKSSPLSISNSLVSRTEGEPPPIYEDDPIFRSENSFPSQKTLFNAEYLEKY